MAPTMNESDLIFDINDLYKRGYSIDEIAEKLNISAALVVDYLDI